MDKAQLREWTHEHPYLTEGGKQLAGIAGGALGSLAGPAGAFAGRNAAYGGLDYLQNKYLEDQSTSDALKGAGLNTALGEVGGQLTKGVLGHLGKYKDLVGKFGQETADKIWHALPAGEKAPLSPSISDTARKAAQDRLAAVETTPAVKPKYKMMTNAEAAPGPVQGRQYRGLSPEQHAILGKADPSSIYAQPFGEGYHGMYAGDRALQQSAKADWAKHIADPSRKWTMVDPGTPATTLGEKAAKSALPDATSPEGYQKALNAVTGALRSKALSSAGGAGLGFLTGGPMGAAVGAGLGMGANMAAKGVGNGVKSIMNSPMAQKGLGQAANWAVKHPTQAQNLGQAVGRTGVAGATGTANTFAQGNAQPAVSAPTGVPEDDDLSDLFNHKDKAEDEDLSDLVPKDK